jgi:uncharacterized OB-fold protein
MLFIHWHIVEQTRVVASRCAQCDRVVAFSPRNDCLVIAENAHTIAAHTKTKPRTVTLSAPDKIFFSA